MTTETATWCTDRNGYADDVCGDDAAAGLHVHYDIEYDTRTGKVLTPREEQERRRIVASPDLRLWKDATYALLHAKRGAIYASAKFLREHPAMVELLRRERQREGARLAKIARDAADRIAGRH